ncbi:MAG: DNA pilot protein [Microviridae sp.]|nr:MAG: DNA pilot protein [Microviridae sp.]AXQ65906.1 MAG: DNA pilot protein [Microviridae sp.]
MAITAVTPTINSGAAIANSPVISDSALTPFNGLQDRISSITSSNTATSASEAEKLRKWQEVQNQKMMDFNAAEAAKSRDWQKMMSDTAHQREIADLQAAGLNPILSAMNGNGASVTSGATASGATSSGAKGEPDTSETSALVSLLGTILNTQMQLNASNTSALTNLAIADKYTGMSKITSDISAMATMSAAGAAAAASRYSADQNRAGALERQREQNEWDANHPSGIIEAINGLVAGSQGLGIFGDVQDNFWTRAQDFKDKWYSDNNRDKMYSNYKDKGYYD